VERRGIVSGKSLARKSSHSTHSELASSPA
jgi:hypothetical protein